MANKLDIQNTINSNIRSNPSLIDKTEHADVEDLQLINSYGDIVNEVTSTAVICVSNSNFNFNLNFIKQGRNVTIYGVLESTTATLLGFGVNILGFTNSDFSPSELSDWYSSDGNYYIHTIGGSTFLRVNSAFGGNSSKRINFTYPTKN